MSSRNQYNTYLQFSRNLTYNPGQLGSLIEDIADDIYRVRHNDENPEALWDSVDQEDEG